MLFSEQYFNSKSRQTGSIEVICGSMFSGKTEELIRRLKRARFAGLPIEIFKPEMEVRYSESEIVSHDDNSIASIPVAHSSEILSLRAETKIVGIDEAQFFDQGLVDACVRLANRGIRVIVAGLDMDYLGKPFGPIPDLLAIAEHITKVYAICMRCGAPAHYSYRTVVDQEKILLGERESYEPRCRSCFYESQDV